VYQKEGTGESSKVCSGCPYLPLGNNSNSASWGKGGSSQGTPHNPRLLEEVVQLQPPATQSYLKEAPADPANPGGAKR